jgi:arylsulfatase A-like enzyme
MSENLEKGSNRLDQSPSQGMVRKKAPLADFERQPIRGRDLLFLSAWCGLAAGLLEVGTKVLYRAIEPSQRLYLMSHHFIWLSPLANLAFFVVIGLLLAVAIMLAPRATGWFGPRLLCACMILPVLLVAEPRIYSVAWLVVSFGFAAWLVPVFWRYRTAVRTWLRWSFPFMLGLVFVIASFVFGADWLARSRESGRPMPPDNSPNILFIVLDTVRADRLSLYGYARPTTPNLEQLSKRGIRFGNARATAPWTLPSHASMFTGHWPHDVGAQWLTPLRGNLPTLAEYIGAHGYATAGFVSNVVYCSQESGLARGFTHYEDYELEKLAPLRTSILVAQMTSFIFEAISAFDIVPLYPVRDFVARLFVINPRKDAASISRELLNWLAHRSEPDRPFFAFLNLLDAHDPYRLPDGVPYRFMNYTATTEEFRAIELWRALDKTKLPRSVINMARDFYDDCLLYIDEQLGILLDQLQHRGVLEKTLIVVTSDHGEGLGEHGLFDHGESLYRTEIRVPLVIVPFSGLQMPTVVDEPVSLRDLPATIVDMVGQGTGSPFPGDSLARFWGSTGSNGARSPRVDDPVVSELMTPNPARPNQGRSPAANGPLVSLAKGDFVYIRNEGDGGEQLFNQRLDPQEVDDRSRFESMHPVLAEFRNRLDLFRRTSASSRR